MTPTPETLRKWAEGEDWPLPCDLLDAADAWQLLIDAVNETDQPCPPECDSIAHAEGCPHIDRAAWMAKQQATIVDLRKRLEAAEKELAHIQNDRELWRREIGVMEHLHEVEVGALRQRLEAANRLLDRCMGYLEGDDELRKAVYAALAGEK